MIRTAILVDGGFYRKRSHFLWGELTAAERADELQNYTLANFRRNERELKAT